MDLPGEAQRQADLSYMKRLASGLLAAVTIAFVAASVFERRYPWLGFVRATAEAAMVGAIADWFAVTALFRHPLGLRIPHTAIIPQRKDSIGASIGRFVHENFLSADIILARLRTLNIAQLGASWMIQPAASERIARLATAGIAGSVQVMNDADVQTLIEHGLAARVRATRAAPLLGRLLALVLSEKHRTDLLDAAITFAARLLEQNQAAIRARISREIPWWLPRSIDKEVYRKLFDAVEAAMREVSRDPAHPLRDTFDDEIRRLIDDLQSNPEVIAKGEALKEELLAHPIVRDLAASLWADIKVALRAQSVAADSQLQQSIQRAIVQLGAVILRDQGLSAKVNQWAEEIALYAIQEYGSEAAHMIEQTVKNWDAEAMSRKIELQIGRDLQYIRINGTVVGGIVGLLIYSVALLVRL